MNAQTKYDEGWIKTGDPFIKEIAIIILVMPVLVLFVVFGLLLPPGTVKIKAS